MPLTATKRKVKLSLGAGVVLVGAAGALAIVSVRRLDTSARRVARTHEVRTQIELVRANVARTDAFVEGSLPAGETAARAELDARLASTRDALARLDAITRDNSEQSRLLADAERALAARQDALAAAVAAAARPRPAPTLDSALAAARVPALTARLTAVLDTVDAGEQRLLVQRLATQRATVRETTLVVLLLILIGGSLGVMAHRSIARDLERRMATEKALRAAEQRFHATFDQAFQLTFLLTPGGEVMEANETALLFHGPRDVIARRAVWELPAWGDRARDAIRDAVASAAGGAFVRLEETGRGADGRDVTFDMSFKPMHDAGGGVAGVIHEARDITERKAAESALRTSEAKFAGILSIAADAIITIDEAQRIVHFNHGAEEIFGYQAAELLGQPLEPLLPLAARAEHHDHVARFARSPETARRMGARREVSGRRKNGEEFPAEASISKLESDGRLLFTVVLRDVTERRRAEDRQRFLAQAGDALAASLDYRQTLAEVARLALPTLGDACIVDVDGEDGLEEIAIAHVDPEKEAAVRELRRRHPIPMNGPHPLAVVRRTGQPMLVPVIDDPFLARTTTSEEHARTVRGLAVRSAMFVPLTARDHILGVLSYYTEGPRAYTDDDLALATELAQRAALAIDNARLYEESRRSSAARDEVLAVVSHDLRNPLSTIGMCASALLDPEPAPHAAVRSMAGTIQESADWMQRIIRDLLDVASIEAGRLALDRHPIRAASVLATTRELLHRQAHEAGLDLVVEEVGALPYIEGDHERLLQVLLNLVGNALKFTPAGGRVVVRAEADDGASSHDDRRGGGAGPAGHVRFSVADTGSGIAESHLPRIFDRFWQVRATGRAGAGLGLAIAKGIVEAHGGEMTVSSTVGVGTTFAFTVPAAVDANGMMGGKAAVLPKSSARARRLSDRGARES